MTTTDPIPTTSAATLVERRDGLVIVTFNRPAKKNALGTANWADLDTVLTEVERNPEDRALLLTGAGGNFSSGADLSGGLDDGSTDGPGGLTGRGPQPILHEMRIIGGLVSRLKRLPKPTVAAVDGVAYGVAFGLALACDLVLASDRARFCEVFARRGMALDGGSSWTLPRIVGPRRAKQLAFFGDVLPAEQALAWGLVNEVVPADELEATALEWGQRLASGPTTALSLIKRLIDDGEAASFEEAVEDEARAQHVAFTTHDMREGIQAFLERREPSFRGS
jgi:2-(1,2-epoxy-1,2-dihydrophenyl)acetyl-CoA isomerase